MKLVKTVEKSTLWDSVSPADTQALISESVIKDSKRDYKLIERLSKGFNQKTELSITNYDREILKNFLENRQMSMGDLFTLNNIEGSQIVASLEKLVDFGLVKRDWDREVEMHIDVVYSLTPEGHHIATKNI